MTEIVVLARKSVRVPNTDFVRLLYAHFTMCKAMNRKKNLTLQERVAVVALLSSKLIQGKLHRGAYKSTAEFFKCHRHTVKRLWDRHLESGDLSIDVGVKKAGAVGRRQKRSDEDLIQVVENTVPLAKRGSLRAVAAASKIPNTTRIRLLVRGCASTVEQKSEAPPHRQQQNGQSSICSFVRSSHHVAV